MSRRIEPGEPTARGPSLGVSFVYVAACCGEDLVKLGFARDPLARLHAFHPRYFEFFDLDTGFLIALDAVAEARRLELRLRRPLAAHRAPPPLTARPAAGGSSEWLRGAWPALAAAAAALAEEGFTVHRPLRGWLTSAFAQRADRVYAWAEQAVPWMDSGQRHASLPRSLARVRDTLDAAITFGLELSDIVSPCVDAWYRALR